MYFSYYEDGYGLLYFRSFIDPYSLMLSEGIPELFYIGLN